MCGKYVIFMAPFIGNNKQFVDSVAFRAWFEIDPRNCGIDSQWDCNCVDCVDFDSDRDGPGQIRFQNLMEQLFTIGVPNNMTALMSTSN